MDPKVAPPFPPGVIIRRSERTLDLKPKIDFGRWRLSSEAQRIGLMVKAALALVEAKANLPIEDRELIARILRHSVEN
jgi:hypothetical protein